MSKHQNQGDPAQSLKGATLRRPPGRRHVLVSSTIVCAAIIALAAIGEIAWPWLSAAVSDEQSQSSDAQELQIGTIELQTGQDQCDLLKFDNATGRTISGRERCHSSVTLDAHGVPIPTGTVHRLDSISKSFLGDGR
jgi:hypothetical protein